MFLSNQSIDLESFVKISWKLFPPERKNSCFLLIFRRFTWDALFYVRRSFNVNNSASFHSILMKLVSKHWKLTEFLFWTSLVMIGPIPPPPERFYCFSVLHKFLKILVQLLSITHKLSNIFKIGLRHFVELFMFYTMDEFFFPEN